MKRHAEIAHATYSVKAAFLFRFLKHETEQDYCENKTKHQDIILDQSVKYIQRYSFASSTFSQNLTQYVLTSSDTKIMCQIHKYRQVKLYTQYIYTAYIIYKNVIILIK